MKSWGTFKPYPQKSSVNKQTNIQKNVVEVLSMEWQRIYSMWLLSVYIMAVLTTTMQYGNIQQYGQMPSCSMSYIVGSQTSWIWMKEMFFKGRHSRCGQKKSLQKVATCEETGHRWLRKITRGKCTKSCHTTLMDLPDGSVGGTAGRWEMIKCWDKNRIGCVLLIHEWRANSNS